MKEVTWYKTGSLGPPAAGIVDTLEQTTGERGRHITDFLCMIHGFPIVITFSSFLSNRFVIFFWLWTSVSSRRMGKIIISLVEVWACPLSSGQWQVRESQMRGFWKTLFPMGVRGLQVEWGCDAWSCGSHLRTIREDSLGEAEPKARSLSIWCCQISQPWPTHFLICEILNDFVV